MLLKEVKFGYLSKEIVLERCRWYPFCWMKRKINRDRRRQITGQTWPWVRATPSSPVSPYSKVSTKSLPRTGLLSLDLHVHWKCTGDLAIFGEYLFLDFSYELIHKIKFSLKCNLLKYIVLIESMSSNVAILKNVIFINPRELLPTNIDETSLNKVKMNKITYSHFKSTTFVHWIIPLCIN